MLFHRLSALVVLGACVVPMAAFAQTPVTPAQANAKVLDAKAVPSLNEQINMVMQEYLAQDQAIREAERKDMQTLSANNGSIEQQQAVIDRYRLQLDGLHTKTQINLKSLHDRMQAEAKARLEAAKSR